MDGPWHFELNHFYPGSQSVHRRDFLSPSQRDKTVLSQSTRKGLMNDAREVVLALGGVEAKGASPGWDYRVTTPKPTHRRGHEAWGIKDCHSTENKTCRECSWHFGSVPRLPAPCCGQELLALGWGTERVLPKGSWKLWGRPLH